MKSRYQRPDTALADYLRTVLIIDGSSEADEAQLPLFTNGIPALICTTTKEENSLEQVKQLTLFGKSAPEECWNVDDKTIVIAYFFKPFALATIFNQPAADLIKTPVNLFNWNPHIINAVNTQLIYAQTTARKIEVLDNLLIQQLELNKKECEFIRYATDEMMCNPGTEILSMLLEKLHLNERTFQRLFKKYVGVTPNQYRRICQFQVSFSQLREKDFTKLTDVAYDNGFADQSHFIRSFKEFTQITPNDYLQKGLKKEE